MLEIKIANCNKEQEDVGHLAEFDIITRRQICLAIDFRDSSLSLGSHASKNVFFCISPLEYLTISFSDYAQKE